MGLLSRRSLESRVPALCYRENNNLFISPLPEAPTLLVATHQLWQTFQMNATVQAQRRVFLSNGAWGTWEFMKSMKVAMSC